MQRIGSLALKTSKRLRLRGAEDDEALMAAIARRDQDAMRTLYERHHVRIFRFATRLVGDAATAEDVVSETFMDVWRQAERFEGRSAVTTWIMSIARFKALTARVRRPEVVLDEEVAETVADEADTPEQSALATDRAAQLRECLKKLTAEHREIVDLVYYHGKTIDEVAEIIQAPKNTVKTRMFYARKRLAQLLAQHQDFGLMTSGKAA